MEGPATETETARLRSLSAEAVPSALEKAKHYRLLNEPEEAESICLDILEVQPEHQPALIQLLLARTDQFATRGARAVRRAREVLPRLEGDYPRAYYEGIVCERHAKVLLEQRSRHSGTAAWEWFQRALGHFETAIDLRPRGDDDAILRWNTCVRMIERHAHCRPNTRPDHQFGIE
ncbi:MAG: hypothetical protein R3266_03815 [Gemmatimonadota bacterium]|nr:hypothetical protein [Gemmatimonadota bacterium]